jgi:hypothetical protein
MAVSVTVQSLGKNGDRYYLTFADGTQYEFATLADVAEWSKDLDADVSLLHKLMLRQFIAKGGTVATTSQLVGKKLTLDLTLANILKVT